MVSFVPVILFQTCSALLSLLLFNLPSSYALSVTLSPCVLQLSSFYCQDVVSLPSPSPLLSICPASCVLRCTQCHCSDNYLLKCLCLRPSVCGCHLCLVRCMLPCVAMSCPWGEKASHGVTSLRFPHKHRLMHTLC